MLFVCGSDLYLQHVKQAMDQENDIEKVRARVVWTMQEELRNLQAELEVVLGESELETLRAMEWQHLTRVNGNSERVRAMAVKLALEQGADVNAAIKHRDTTPLVRAASFSDLGLVHTLLSAGADANLGSASSGVTPLLAAALRGDMRIAQALLDAGAKADLASKDDGTTPLLVAAQEGHLHLARMLLGAGADVAQVRS